MIKQFRYEQIYVFTAINKWNIECIVATKDSNGNDNLMMTGDARFLPDMKKLATQLQKSVGKITLSCFTRRMHLEEMEQCNEPSTN